MNDYKTIHNEIIYIYIYKYINNTPYIEYILLDIYVFIFNTIIYIIRGTLYMILKVVDTFLHT